MKIDKNSLAIEEAGLQLPQLTERQYYAAFAMQGMLANTNGCITESGFHSLNPATIARAAVTQADYLIDHLNNNPL